MRKAQMVVEATKGTGIPATSIWRGPISWDDDTTIREIEEAIGVFIGYDREVETQCLGLLTLEPTPLTPEQFPYICAASIKDVVSGSADGAGSGKIYTYPFSTTTMNSVKAYTWEVGDNQQAWEGNYGGCVAFNISGGGGADADPIMMSADWVIREWAKTTFTAALSVPAVNSLVFAKSKLFIDAIGGTIGTTQKTGTMVDFALRVDPGMRLMRTGDGQLYYTDIDLRAMPSVRLELGMLYNANTIAQIDNYLARTHVLLEIDCIGDDLGTAGTTYSTKKVRIQLPGYWEDFSGLDGVQGGDRVTGTFVSKYNPTASLGPQIICVNELASLT